MKLFLKEKSALSFPGSKMANDRENRGKLFLILNKSLPIKKGNMISCMILPPWFDGHRMKFLKFLANNGLI